MPSTIVTICGSMRFFDHMLKVAADETARGNIVLAPFSVVAPDDQGGEFKEMLDRLHFEKIDMSERIVVVTDENGYIGESTSREIAHAVGAEKAIDIREFNNVTRAEILPDQARIYTPDGTA